MLSHILIAALSLVTVALSAPTGGQGLNGTANYTTLSDYDFQSFNLALQQEWLELYLFRAGLSTFSQSNFTQANFTSADVALLEYMAAQEVGHAQLLTNILGPNAAKPCNYSFPFTSIPEFIDLSRRVTRVGESGVFGFLQHVDSRASAELLGQAIATESRQQMVFRQFQGLFPMPVWFVPSITQSMAWTLQAPFLASCPTENPKVEWQNFPALNVTNAPQVQAGPPAISTNATIFAGPGTQFNLTWDQPGKSVGPNNTYNTSSQAGQPQFAAWISQLNVTYTPLTNVSNNSAITTQPPSFVFSEQLGNITTPTLNETIFLLITDNNTVVTPYNLSQIEPHIVAGPALLTIG